MFKLVAIVPAILVVLPVIDRLVVLVHIVAQ